MGIWSTRQLWLGNKRYYQLKVRSFKTNIEPFERMCSFNQVGFRFVELVCTLDKYGIVW